MKIQTKILFLTFALSLFSFGSCKNSNKSNSSNEKEIINIGAILPLSGPASVYGEYVKSGQEKALKEVNENLKDTPFTLEVKYEDGKGIPKESLLAYNKLRSEGVEIFNSTISSVCLSILPQAKNDNVLFFADAAHPELTSKDSPLVFRHSNTSTQEVELILEHIGNSEKYNNVALITLSDDYGKAFEEDFKKKVLQNQEDAIVYEDNFGRNETDFNILAQKLNKANPDVAILVGFGQSLGLLIKAVRNVNPDIHIIASIGYIITGSPKVAGEAAKGIEIVNFDFKDADGGVAAFETLGYGTTKLIGEALKKGHSNPTEISNFIKSLSLYETSVEKMSLSDYNNISPELKIEAVTN